MSLDTFMQTKLDQIMKDTSQKSCWTVYGYYRKYFPQDFPLEYDSFCSHINSHTRYKFVAQQYSLDFFTNTRYTY